MEIVTWRGFASLARLALIGVGVAFAGVIVSLFLGFGGAAAHADEGEERGLLGAVTGLVDDATSLVGSTVTEVAATATDAVTAVSAVAPAPVRQPVHAVVQTVGEGVTTIVGSVDSIAPDGVVTTVTQPVVSLVTEVPVVGDVVSALGVDATVTDLGSSVDGLLDTTVAALTTTAGTIGQPGGAPPAIDTDPAVPAAASPAAATAPAAFVAARAAASLFSTPGYASSFTDSASAATERSFAGDPPVSGPPGGLCLSTPAGTASGGPGSGAWALAALLPFAAHRAWVRRTGSGDDDAPVAPFFDADVSPD